jgi:uncharacterized membrane protein YeaQ/YmgE (transglycosylase-associated protein family)
MEYLVEENLRKVWLKPSTSPVAVRKWTRHSDTEQRRHTMGWLSWIVLGGIAGALAKWIMPGEDPGGIFVTILIGIAGGLLGGFVGTQLGMGGVSGFNLISLGLAIGGAVVLLLVYRMAFKKSE